ncbi:MAG: bifunctional pyr operon transcriptional regulator/uracil phosphoribosyltransferase PyrR [Xanthomonadales bacterium]|nr:bifunctional pyr operon transcriptional regulator/uracil phosphoribosyltransferase PyrR [Xanthomonadales bacterium]
MQIELPEVEPLLSHLTETCSEVLAADGTRKPLIVGVRTGGLWVAQTLSERLGITERPGEIDVGFHRDDFHHRGIPQRIQPTHLPQTEDRLILLVDDVLHTGRTIRAAINALFEFGRPATIRLAVLLTRPGRELPIQPDALGGQLELPEDVRIKLTGPDPLEFVLEKPAHD